MAKDAIAAVGHRIRELRIAAGLTLDQLAERVSLIRGEPAHFTTIAKIERSQRTISIDWIMQIAEALGLAPGDILTPTPRQPVRMVPVIGRIAAGGWQEAIQEPIGEVPVPHDTAGPNAFSLRPTGDSMNLVFADGGYVIVDPDQVDLLDGKYYAIMNGDGETTFKRFRADPPRLEPQSSNPAHQMIPLGREPFTTIGRVVYQLQPF
jgi:repressor LexA